MPAYKLAPASLDELRATLEHAQQQNDAGLVFLEQMDPERSLTQNALRHNHKTAGALTEALRQVESLRELVRSANRRATPPGEGE